MTHLLQNPGKPATLNRCNNKTNHLYPFKSGKRIAPNMAQNRVQHTLDSLRFRPRNQVVALGVLGLIIVLIFGGVYLSQVAQFATTNRQIEEFINERDRLERTNEQIRATIAELETIPRLLTRARELGFSPAVAASVEYIIVNGYNPDRSRTVVPVSLADRLEVRPQYDETFSGWIQQQFDNLRLQFEGFGGSS